MIVEARKRHELPRNRQGRQAAPIRTASPVLRRLFEVADEKGMTLRYLAEGGNWTTAQVSGWRAGTHAPSIINVEELAAIIGVRLIDG